MIFDSLKNKDNYRDFPLLYEALCYLSTLKNHKKEALGNGLISESLLSFLILFIIF